MNKLVGYNLLAGLLFIIDRGLKFSVFSNLLAVGSGGFKIVPFFYWSPELNTRLAFSLPLSNNWGIVLMLVMLGVLAIWYIQNYEQNLRQINFFLLLIMFGALSNLIDRVVAGGVIDYWRLADLSVLNLADIMISLGLLGLLVDIFWPAKKLSA